MDDTHEHRLRVARQHLQTNRLLGLDFIPRRAASTTEGGPAVAASTVPAEAGEAPPPPQRGTGESLIQGQLSFEQVGDPPPERDPSAKAAALDELRARHDETCPHCTAATAHSRTVFGETNPDAELMFIGEAPGEEEDRTGRPFVGRAGKKLDEMITAMGLKRADVYITNLLKSRPPANRTPLPSEVEACSPFLAEQIRKIRPRVIVALGGPATKWLLRTSQGITRLRGTWATYVDGPLVFPVMPTFHPAYLLRNYTLDTRTKVWTDMQAVMVRLSGVSAP